MSLQEKLVKLFTLDNKVRELRAGLDAAERRHQAQATRLEQFTRQRDELEDQLRHARAHAATLENEVNSLDERIAEHRQQMGVVTDNKAYKALNVEVDTLKKEKGKLEDEALEGLNRIDELEKELEEARERVNEQGRVLERAGQELKEQEAQIRERLQTLETERDTAAEEVPEDARAIFWKQTDIHDGEALAPVLEIDRRRLEYTCGGCYMSIPVERVNMLASRGDEITYCPSCQRILYLDEELKTSMRQ